MSSQNFSELDFFKKRLSQTENLLGIKQRQIDSLLEITRSVNNNMPITALARIYENILRAQMGVTQVAFFIRDNDQKGVCLSSSNIPTALFNYDFVSKFSAFAHITPVKAINDPLLEGFEYLIPSYHDKKMIGATLIGSFGKEQSDTQEEKLKFIQTITNIIAVANENKKLMNNQIDQLVMQKELELAAQMQNMLVPSNLPNNEVIEASAFYKPHKNIGGDYYDFVQISDFEYAFCISDISGKGIPAAILMANFQANMRILLTRRYPLTQFVDVLNGKVCEITKGEKFITCFIGIYNSKTRKLSYVNAGHNPSIVLDKNGIRLLEDGCTILGMFENLPFIASGETEIMPGSVVVNYTDGLTEAMNNDGKLFELDGLIRFINSNHQMELTEFTTKLIDQVITFKQDTDFDDDITLLTLRLK